MIKMQISLLFISQTTTDINGNHVMKECTTEYTRRKNITQNIFHFQFYGKHCSPSHLVFIKDEQIYGF